jgi:hypothetical protein
MTFGRPRITALLLSDKIQLHLAASSPCPISSAGLYLNRLRVVSWQGIQFA